MPDTGGIPATVIVTIDAQDLIDRVGHGRTADGTVLPTAKLLQLANNADIIPTVLTALAGSILGRSRRIASRPQTLALIARDGGCSFPGCTHPPQYAKGTTSGLRAAVLRRSEKTRSSSSSADDVGGLERNPASGASNQTQSGWMVGSNEL